MCAVLEPAPEGVDSYQDWSRQALMCCASENLGVIPKVDRGLSGIQLRPEGQPLLVGTHRDHDCRNVAIVSLHAVRKESACFAPSSASLRAAASTKSSRL